MRSRLTITLAALSACLSQAGTISVPAGGNFQEALGKAQPGDVIQLAAGATFTGPFQLPVKEGDDWITIRTDAADSALPPAGERVQPSHSEAMPKLVSATDWVVTAEPRAHHYRFIGIEFHPAPGIFLHNLVLLGDGSQTSEETLPHDIVFDRCYFHGDSKKGARRGIALNAREVAITSSYLSDFKEVGAQSQAIAGWNGPGPFHITNNYLAAAGENILFGGSDPAIPNLVPSDIEIRQNHFYKPLSWKRGDPSYEGAHWAVANLLELKSARRVRVEGNILENNWADVQSGFAIVLTVRNQDGGAPWSVIEDVSFLNNIVRHAAAGINFLGRDDAHASGQARRIAVRNNLFYELGGKKWGGSGRLFQLLNGTADVVIDHNTALQTGHIISADGDPHTGFQYTNNIASHNEYGMHGSGTAPGRQTLQKYFPDAVVRANVVAGGKKFDYPSGNYLTVSLDDPRFIDSAVANYRLAEKSPYKKAATDGKDIGVDMDLLEAATAGRAPGRASDSAMAKRQPEPGKDQNVDRNHPRGP